MPIYTSPQLAAGALSSYCTTIGGQLYAWGKLKVSGDNTMYPKPLMELAGWDIRSLACGTQTNAAAASADGEEAAITWCVVCSSRFCCVGDCTC